MATRIVLTYAAYGAIPTAGKRSELHEGDLSVTPAPGVRHQRVIGSLFTLLRQHVIAAGAGEVLVSPVDCILSETSVVQPDIVYNTPDRLTAISDAEPRTVQASELSGDAYRPAGTLEGGRPVARPPSPDLPLEPAAIWL